MNFKSFWPEMDSISLELPVYQKFCFETKATDIIWYTYWLYDILILNSYIKW